MSKEAEEKPPTKITVLHFASDQGDPDDDPDHVRSENEVFYDEEIAPRLREIAEMCNERKMSIVADVEYDPGGTGSTRFVQANAGAKMKITYAASKCRGNVDALIMSVFKWMEKTDQIKVSVYMTLIDDWKNGRYEWKV